MTSRGIAARRLISHRYKFLVQEARRTIVALDSARKLVLADSCMEALVSDLNSELFGFVVDPLSLRVFARLLPIAGFHDYAAGESIGLPQRAQCVPYLSHDDHSLCLEESS